MSSSCECSQTVAAGSLLTAEQNARTHLLGPCFRIELLAAAVPRQQHRQQLGRSHATQWAVRRSCNTACCAYDLKSPSLFQSDLFYELPPPSSSNHATWLGYSAARISTSSTRPPPATATAMRTGAASSLSQPSMRDSRAGSGAGARCCRGSADCRTVIRLQ